MTYDEKLKLADAARCGFLGSKIEYTPIMDCKPTARKRWLRVVDAVLSGSRVPMLEIKVKNQRMELRNLYGLREQEAIATQKLRAEVAALNDALASVEVELADKAFYVTEFAAVSKERDDLKAELAAVKAETRQVPPGVPNVRDLVNIGTEAYNKAAFDGLSGKACSENRDAAIRNAVIAGMQGPAPFDSDAWKTPLKFTSRIIGSCKMDVQSGDRGVLFVTWNEGKNNNCTIAAADAATLSLWLASYAAANGCPVNVQQPERRDPTDAEVEELAKVLHHSWRIKANSVGEWDDCEESKNEWLAEARASFAYFSRVPVGWELDVPENGWLAEGFCIHNHATGETHSVDSFVNHVCSRIRPVYECKECAKAEAEIRQWRNANDELVRRAAAARAALEGE